MADKTGGADNRQLPFARLGVNISLFFSLRGECFKLTSFGLFEEKKNVGSIRCSCEVSEAGAVRPADLSWAPECDYWRACQVMVSWAVPFISCLPFFLGELPSSALLLMRWR